MTEAQLQGVDPGEGRHAGTQAGYQLALLAVTLGISILGGLLTGACSCIIHSVTIHLVLYSKMQTVKRHQLLYVCSTSKMDERESQMPDRWRQCEILVGTHYLLPLLQMADKL